MSRWFRVYDDLVDDPKVQMLTPAAFKAAFMQALAGEETECSPFVRQGRGRLTGPEWQKLRAEVFSRDDFTCTYCGERAGRLECDHVIPASRGGSDELDNLATACFACNRSKRDKLLSEWRQ